MFKRLTAIALLAAALAAPTRADILFSGVPMRVMYKYTGTRMNSFVVQFRSTDRDGITRFPRITFKVTDNAKDVKDYKDLAHALSQADQAWLQGANFEMRFTSSVSCTLGTNNPSCFDALTVNTGAPFQVSRSYESPFPIGGGGF